MHCPKLQPSGWGIEDTRRNEEEGRARLSLAEGSDLLCFAAGWRPPTRRSASPMLLLWSRGSSSLSLTILAKVRDAVRDRWNRRAKEDAKKRRRKKDGAPARGAAPEADLESARTGPMGKRKIKYIISSRSLPLSLSIQAVPNSWCKSIAWLKNRNSRSLSHFTRHNLPNSAGLVCV